jgi:putative tryptophan/tyrosine transport system substrate-binding protein
VRRDAEELVALSPDVLVAGIGPTTQEFQRITRTLPIVFTQAVDPVGIGTVKSMARPGGNATGFIQFEYSLSAKWLELLRDFVPRVARVGIVRDRMYDGRAAPVSLGQWAVIGAAASPHGVEILPVDVDVTADIENAFTEFARGPNDGLIVGVGTAATIQGKLVVALAARHKLPAVYPYRFFVETGGLMSYGPNLIDLYRRSASYVDRILRGEKPDDLPVQAPTKYELVINLKTAKALGLAVPDTLRRRGD